MSGLITDINETTRNIAQIGLVKKIEKSPLLIIRDPLKFCSAVAPKIMPKIIADGANLNFFKN